MQWVIPSSATIELVVYTDLGIRPLSANGMRYITYEGSTQSSQSSVSPNFFHKKMAFKKLPSFEQAFKSLNGTVRNGRSLTLQYVEDFLKQTLPEVSIFLLCQSSANFLGMGDIGGWK
jgi:hypothetical protein